MADLIRDDVPSYRVIENTSTPGFPYSRMSVGSWGYKKKASGWESPEVLQKEHRESGVGFILRAKGCEWPREQSGDLWGISSLS